MTGFVTKKISNKRSLGSVLKSARTKADLTIEQAEKETKICLKYLVALESGDYAALPAEAYNVGFIRTYAQLLRLNQEKILRMYREERSQMRFASPANSVNLAPRRMSNWHFLITPRVLGIIALLVVFGSLTGYAVKQLSDFSKIPPISLLSPLEFTSNKDTVTLAGKTVAGASLLMNNEPILVAPDGSFSQAVQLSPGVNNVVIQSTSRAQKRSQIAVKVLYDQQGVANLPQSVTKE